MNNAHRIAAFAAGFDPAALTLADVAVAARSLLDTHAVAIAGWNEPTSLRLRRYLAGAATAAPGASLWGEQGGQADAEQAALANGVAAHVLDYDDVSSPMRGHPSVALWPALLALGEQRDLPGARLASAYAVGFEVIVKLARAMAQPHYAQGWHSTPGLGTLGCAAACSHLLGLDAPATAHALGIAVAQTAGTRQNFGSDTKSFQAGHANMAGLRAALLAETGFTAGEAALDGAGGFVDLYGGSPGLLDAPVGALGDAPLELHASGIEVKKYPMCYAAHRALDGLLDLRREHGLALDDVAKVDVTCARGSLVPLIHSRPLTGLQGKFSMEYAVAAALADGAVRLASFEDAAVQRPALQAFFAHVRVAEAGDALFPRWTALRLKLRDGRVLEHRVEALRGSAELPLRDDELFAKVADCHAYAGRTCDPLSMFAAAMGMQSQPVRVLLRALNNGG